MPLVLLLLAALSGTGREASNRATVLVPSSVDTSGVITVVAIDSLDNELSSVDLILESDSGDIRRVGRTNRAGVAIFSQLPGNRSYTLRAKRIGVIPQSRIVRLEVGQELMVTLVMARLAQRLSDVKTGKKTGKIVGRVVPFGVSEFHWAVIELTDSVRYNKQITVGNDGTFFIDGIPAGGLYQMTVKSMGFESVFIPNLDIQAGSPKIMHVLLVWTGNLSAYPVDPRYLEDIDFGCKIGRETFLNGVSLGFNTTPPPLILSELKPEDIIETKAYGCDPAIPKILWKTVWITARINRTQVLAQRAQQWKQDRPWHYVTFGFFLSTIGAILFF